MEVIKSSLSSIYIHFVVAETHTDKFQKFPKFLKYIMQRHMDIKDSEDLG